MTIADRFDGFLIDLDGVVYLGEALIPGADDAVSVLRAMDKHLLFLTNDPRSSREEYATKLRRLGVEVKVSEILTAGVATGAYIARHEETANRTAFVIGTPALKREMQSAGLTLIEGEQGSGADFVVVGGHDAFGYAELRIASRAVRQGARFYATGRDATFPMPDGPWPATGAILAAVETAAGRQAHVIGKPEPEMFRVAQEHLPEGGRYAVIGDRLDSDIAGAHRVGLGTILVLTGTSMEAEAIGSSRAPDIVIPDLTSLVRDI